MGADDASRTGGFSLLEVVVALAVVGMVLAGVLGSVGAGLRAGDAAIEAAEATILADDVLSRVALLPAEALVDVGSRGGRLEAPYESYRWSAASRRVHDEPGLYEVTIALVGPRGTTRVTTRLHRPRSDGGE